MVIKIATLKCAEPVMEVGQVSVVGRVEGREQEPVAEAAESEELQSMHPRASGAVGQNGSVESGCRSPLRAVGSLTGRSVHSDIVGARDVTRRVDVWRGRRGSPRT